MPERMEIFIKVDSLHKEAVVTEKLCKVNSYQGYNSLGKPIDVFYKQIDREIINYITINNKTITEEELNKLWKESKSKWDIEFDTICDGEIYICTTTPTFKNLFEMYGFLETLRGFLYCIFGSITY